MPYQQPISIGRYRVALAKTQDLYYENSVKNEKTSSLYFWSKLKINEETKSCYLKVKKKEFFDKNSQDLKGKIKPRVNKWMLR